MKFNVSFKENDKKINVTFSETSVVSDGGFELGYAEGKAQGELDGYIKGNEEGRELGRLEGFENAKLQTEEISITENGEYEPTGEIIGFKKVSVNVVGKSKLAEFVSDTTPYDITEIDLAGVTTLPDYSFAYKKNLRRVEIPSSVTKTLTKYTFYNSTIEEIAMNGLGTATYFMEKSTSLKKVFWNAKSVSSYSFSQATNLTDVELTDKVTEIGGNAFSGCSKLSNLKLTDSIIYFNSNCFENCSSLTEIHIPQNTTRLNGLAFFNCTSMKDVYFDAYNLSDYSSTNTGVFVVSSTYNTSSVANAMSTVLHIGKNVKKIPSYMFRGVYSYSSSTYYISYIHSIVFDDESICETINTNAFQNNKFFTSIIFPKSLKSFANYSFDGCSNLKTIKVQSETPPTLAVYTFRDVTFEKVIVPKGKLDTYKKATNWSMYADYMEEATE